MQKESLMVAVLVISLILMFFVCVIEDDAEVGWNLLTLWLVICGFFFLLATVGIALNDN